LQRNFYSQKLYEHFGEIRFFHFERLHRYGDLNWCNFLGHPVNICPGCGKQGWLGSRVVSVLDLSAEGLGFKSQPRRYRVTVLGKLFTPIVPPFTNQRNW